jgi:hypothetical protein
MTVTQERLDRLPVWATDKKFSAHSNGLIARVAAWKSSRLYFVYTAIVMGEFYLKTYLLHCTPKKRLKLHNLIHIQNNVIININICRIQRFNFLLKKGASQRLLRPVPCALLLGTAQV